MNKKVAMILSGCGYLDGTEIREATFAILSLSKHNAKVSYFAPDVNIDAVNHLSGNASKDSRNTLIESARIARGDIQNINQLNSDDYDALIFPGGFGAAQIFCNFATKAELAKVDQNIEKIIRKFHAQNKPIGAICISPVLLALIFGNKNIKLTIGENLEIAEKLSLLGAEHIITPSTGACIDRNLKIVTTPAYMYENATAFDVFVGIDLCVQEILKL